MCRYYSTVKICLNIIFFFEKSKTLKVKIVIHKNYVQEFIQFVTLKINFYTCICIYIDIYLYIFDIIFILYWYGLKFAKNIFCIILNIFLVHGLICMYVTYLAIWLFVTYGGWIKFFYGIFKCMFWIFNF